MIDLDELKKVAVRTAAIHEFPSQNERRLMECTAEFMANDFEEAVAKHNAEMEKLRKDWADDVERLLLRLDKLKMDHSALAKIALYEVKKGISGSSVQALSSLAEIEQIIKPMIITPDSDWFDIATCPKDGTIFDAMRDGIRYTDCFYDEKRGGVIREHGYPSSTTVFGDPPTHWMPRPDGLIEPYEVNQYGEKYVP